MKKVRKVTARRVVGRKNVKNRVYEYVYYTLPLNLYLPRSYIERWGLEYVVIRDDEKGTITVMPLKLAKEQGIEVD